MWHWVVKGEYTDGLRIWRAERLSEQPLSVSRSGPFKTKKEAKEELRLRQAAQASEGQGGKH